MKHGVQNVRRAIKRRKKQREQLDMNPKQEQRTNLRTNSMFISEEEKHGYGMPVYNDDAKLKWKKQQGLFSSSMMIKVLLSIGIFGGSAFLLHGSGSQFAKPEQWLKSQLQEEFPFAKVNQWYVTTLGAPLAISPQGNLPRVDDNEIKGLPVLGHVVETFSTNGTGIMISPVEKSNVTSLDQGVVVFAGNDQQTNKTVIVQHADGSNTTYGLLSSIDVHLYQVVQPNQMIGTFTPTDANEVVYFSIEKNDQFIDPSQVIPVDDIP